MDSPKIDYIFPSEETIKQNIMDTFINRTFFALDSQTSSDEETDYKPLYYGLFNGITSIVKNAATYDEAIAALKQLQSMAEDNFVEQGEL